MKTIAEQIAGKCIHFNGIMNKCCAAGVNYEDVVKDEVNHSVKFPCFKQGGHCSKAQFPTEEEAQKRAAEMKDLGIKTLTAYATIKTHIKETKELSGSIPCACGGTLRYVAAQSNGHIWAKCAGCGIAFNE